MVNPGPQRKDFPNLRRSLEDILKWSPKEEPPTFYRFFHASFTLIPAFNKVYQLILISALSRAVVVIFDSPFVLFYEQCLLLKN